MDNYGDASSRDRRHRTVRRRRQLGERLFTSRLCWLGLAIVGVGVLIGVVAGRRTTPAVRRRARHRRSRSSPASSSPRAPCFATVRGTIINNLWWVIVVTSLATAFGLAVAVLADRAKGENIAKSLIFLPMAISFIGAGIIWRFMYQAREPSQDPRPACSTRSGCGSASEQLATWQKWLVARRAVR